VSAQPLPPRPLKAEDIHIVRKVEGSQVVTHYFDRSGNEVLAPTFHLVGDPTKFDPPPS